MRISDLTYSSKLTQASSIFPCSFSNPIPVTFVKLAIFSCVYCPTFTLILAYFRKLTQPYPLFLDTLYICSYSSAFSVNSVSSSIDSIPFVLLFRNFSVYCETNFIISMPFVLLFRNLSLYSVSSSSTSKPFVLLIS